MTIGFGPGGSNAETDWSSLGGSIEDDYDYGTGVSGQLLYQITSNIALGGEIEYTPYEERNHLGRTFATRMGGKAYTLESLARYMFLVQSRFRPFLIGGVGFSSQSIYARTTPRDGFIWSDTATRETRDNYDTMLNGAAWSLGVGVEGNVLSALTLGVDFRWRYRILNKSVADKALGGNWRFGDSSAGSLMLRLGHQFGTTSARVRQADGTGTEGRGE